MSSEVRERLLLPIGIPLGAFVLLGVLIFSFSRILLAVPREVAIAIALAAALDVLVVAALVAGRREGGPSYHVPLLAVSALAIIGGGMVAAGAKPYEATHAAEAKLAPGKPGAPAAAAFEIKAQNIAFDRKEIDLTAGGNAVIKFTNADLGVPHNVALFKDAGFTQPIFRGQVVTGPAKATYTFPTPPPGSYFFHCDVHPANMQGTVVVKPAAAGAAVSGAPAAGGANTASIEAKNISFDRKQLSLPANVPVVVKFTNGDSGIPHNWALYSDAGHTQAIFKGQIIAGPSTQEYRFRAPPPGTYYFRCDVHPTMQGTVTFR